jgi:TPR repeat protein
MAPRRANAGSGAEVSIDQLEAKANQGDVQAQFKLGEYHSTRGEYPGDFREALKWYTKAAEQGHAGAQYAIGAHYDFPKDPKIILAPMWYRKAAEQGHIDAQFSLGRCYEEGRGVKKDLAESVRWYRKAAEAGDATAQYVVGYAYQHGEGVPQSYPDAVRWHTRAARQGHGESQFELGVAYLLGHGVPENTEEAYIWLNLAAANGVERAGKGRDEVARHLPAKALERAQARAIKLHGEIQRQRR